MTEDDTQINIPNLAIYVRHMGLLSYGKRVLTFDNRVAANLEIKQVAFCGLAKAEHCKIINYAPGVSRGN